MIDDNFRYLIHRRQIALLSENQPLYRHYISLSRIKTHKATGPDEIPNWILHDYAAILAPPVCTIFNSSLREGTMPALWKCADVRPVPKIRPPALIEKDLHPISLTPVLSKCLEKFMCTWIMDITVDQTDPQQYGSIKGTSTVHALVELVHKWKLAVETPGTIVRILLVDFSKAFDRVDHHILMTKCASLGLPNFYHQMADILPVSTQTEGKDWECEIGVHHCQCRCPTRHNIWTNRLPTPY